LSSQYSVKITVIIFIYYVRMTAHKNTKSLKNLQNHKAYKTSADIKLIDRKNVKSQHSFRKCAERMCFDITNWTRLQL